MRLVHLPTFWTIILDIVAWLIIHLAVVAIMVRIPRSRFNPNGPLYSPRFWEKGGRFYERFARIRLWKQHVPDGAEWTKDRGFPKKRLQQRDVDYLKDFLVETCRAELTHWIILFFAPLFFFWNKFWVGWIMIAYALAENVPLIMVQRYNRQRFRRILARKGSPPWSPVMDNIAIAIEDLHKNYSGTQAVCGISLEILEGEFFGLLGPNGAGKTTTIAMLTGLTAPSGGRILVDGLSIFSNPVDVKSRMGFVPQEFAFYPTLNAVENLQFFGRLYGLRGARLKTRIREVLEIAELEDRAHQTVAAFSNGMMRRLNIAIGLIHEPRMLILDEPTVGIDAHSRNSLYLTLDRLNRQGVTILCTTHNMEEAQRLCGRVAIMDHGRILTVDTPSALIRRFGEGLIRVEFKAVVGKAWKERMARLDTVQGLDGRERHWYLKTREPEKAVRALMAMEETREVGIRSLNILEPDLESVFIHLTGRRLRDPAEDKHVSFEG